MHSRNSRNISNIKYSYLSTREFKSTKFSIQVKTATFWGRSKKLPLETHWTRNLVKRKWNIDKCSENPSEVKSSICLVFLGKSPVSRPLCLLYTYV